MAIIRNKKTIHHPGKNYGIVLFDKSRPNGLILCSAHMPLLNVALRVLVENGTKIDALIVKTLMKDNLYPLFGTDYGVPVINNSPGVLLKARTILKEGKVVMALTDEDIGYNNYSPNMFYLAQKLNADIIYFLAELKQDGCIEVSFHEAPTLANNPKDLVNLQISTLNNYRNKILNIEQDFVIEHIG